MGRPLFGGLYASMSGTDCFMLWNANQIALMEASTDPRDNITTARGLPLKSSLSGNPPGWLPAAKGFLW
jgi:hypothetical protein